MLGRVSGKLVQDEGQGLRLETRFAFNGDNAARRQLGFAKQYKFFGHQTYFIFRHNDDAEQPEY